MSSIEIGPIQEKWLQIMESGEYEQGYGNLHITEEVAGEKVDKFCCLGLVSKISEIEMIEDSSEKMESGCLVHMYHSRIGSLDSETVLPGRVHESIGLRCEEGSFKESIRIRGRTYTMLSQLNDSGLVDFPTIAKMIREDPSNFFTESK